MFIHSDDYWKNKTSYIGTNNLELGQTSGILMASQLQPGDQVALLGRTASVDRKRLQGAKSRLEAVGIKIVTEVKDYQLIILKVSGKKNGNSFARTSKS